MLSRRRVQSAEVTETDVVRPVRSPIWSRRFARPTQTNVEWSLEPVEEPLGEIGEGEELKVGFVVQMPVEEVKQRRSIESDEAEPGWSPGMEIGVWEGRAGR